MTRKCIDRFHTIYWTIFPRQHGCTFQQLTLLCRYQNKLHRQNQYCTNQACTQKGRHCHHLIQFDLARRVTIAAVHMATAGCVQTRLMASHSGVIHNDFGSEKEDEYRYDNGHCDVRDGHGIFVWYLFNLSYYYPCSTVS